MLGSHEAQGPAMCAIDGCPQPATHTPWKVQVAPATYIWVRLCSFCGSAVSTTWNLHRPRTLAR
jgi:hypothetical protein